MRPIRLVIAGLNSFKEAQEINFDKLCEGNVFGIFGPTGSGKSTVVDAITLALYGTVERASHKTQGIVNKALTEASVLFEWQLGSGAERKTYRVERKYVAKDESVRCTLARLCELQGEETIVLAEQASQVDQAVQDILGLTEDDFTRAVVLPQGRFAEFLNLQGKERRRMLERIFGLEEYGEQLNRLVGERLKATETTLQGIARSQEVLGAARAEDVAAAKQQVEMSEAALSARKKAAEAARAEREQWIRVRERQQELDQVSQSLQQLQGRASLIATLQAKVERQAAAERVAGPLRTADAAAKRESEAAADLCELVAAVAQAETAEKETQQAAQVAQEAKEQLEEPLVKRLEQLERALGLEQQVAGLDRELVVQLKAGQALRAELDQQSDSSVVLQSTIAELAETIFGLQAGLSQNRIEPQEREQLNVALAAQERLQLVVIQLQEVTDELDARGVQLTAAKQQSEGALTELAIHQKELVERQAGLVELGKAEPASLASGQLDLASSYLTEAEQLAAAGRELDQRRQALMEQEALIDQIKQQIAENESQAIAAGQALATSKAGVFRLEQRVSTAREQNMAATLARGLQPGQPCPVCGAAEHPQPTHGVTDSDLDELAAELAAAREEQQGLQSEQARVLAHVASRRTDCERQQSALATCRAQVLAAEARVEEQLAKLPRQWVTAVAWADVPQQARAHLTNLNEQIQRRNQWQAELNQAKELTQDCADRVSQYRQQAELGRQTMVSHASEIERLAEKQVALQVQEKNRQTELGRCLEELGQVDLAAARTRYQAMDRRSGELEQLLQQKQREKDNLAEQARLTEQRVANLREQHAQARTESRLQQEQLAKLQAELIALTRGVAAAELRREAARQLADLRRQATSTQLAWEQARSQAAAARQRYSAGQEASRLASVAENEARAALALALRREQFVTRDEAEEALAWAESVPEWQQDIKAYKSEQESLQRRVQELTILLAGQSIDEADWLELVKQAEAAVAVHEQAIAALAQARELLKQVRGRHEQWIELEATRVTLASDQSLLTELVALLRGNALVEFMASEHLDAVASIATDWLGLLTGRRYALEIAPDGGFLIRDDGNGGEKRPVYTLSGGETFITSLALALALSSQVQLRGKHRLEFFFLDEGFGSLDPELLEVVMGCLERMQGQEMSIGIISHVPELKERILRQVLVTPAELGGRGSRVRMAIG